LVGPPVLVGIGADRIVLFTAAEGRAFADIAHGSPITPY